MKILFFDTETTSLNPGKICQLSYIVQDNKNVTGKNYFFKVDSVDPRAEEVHGLSVEKLNKLSKGKVFADHVKSIYKDFAEADLIVGHNVTFDVKFIKAEFERQGMKFEPKEQFCTMKHFKPIMCLPSKNGYKFPKLIELSEFLGISSREVNRQVSEIFASTDNTISHDSRYDIVETYLSFKKGIEKGYIEPTLNGEKIPELTMAEKMLEKTEKETTKNALIPEMAI